MKKFLKKCLKKMNRNINKRKKYFVKKINNFTCAKCKNKFSSEELELDHIIPIANGGTNDYNNLQPLCIECHLAKTKGEWKEGYGENKNIDLSPSEKLEILKNFLEENKERSYEDIQFLILNHYLLSTFNYNSNIIAILFKKIKGIDYNSNSNKKWKAQRNSAIKIIHDFGKTYEEISKMMENKGTKIGITQIGSIITGEY